MAKERCRSGTSFAGGEGQCSFADGFGRKEQRFADVISFEVWVQCEDRLCCLPFSHQSDDSRDWNPKTAKTRNSPHLARIRRDPLELHIDSVARRPTICERAFPVPVFVKRPVRSPPPPPLTISFTASPGELERLDPRASLALPRKHSQDGVENGVQLLADVLGKKAQHEVAVLLQ